MATLRNMAHDAGDINWEARKRAEELSQRAPEPDYGYRKPPARFGMLALPIIVIAAAGLLAITWIIYL